MQGDGRHYATYQARCTNPNISRSSKFLHKSSFLGSRKYLTCISEEQVTDYLGKFVYKICYTTLLKRVNEYHLYLP